MSTSGGQPGNKNAEKKIWTAAISRALEKRGTKKIAALDALAERLLSKCDEGDMTALKELGDRLEGKPQQSANIEHSGNIGLAHVLGTIGSPSDD